ncbi:hypothetical protein CLH62_12520 [Marinobacter guineae]|jgi:hypothetical protein|uniref:Uncharacterized protein n=1 Tax=Marinobacter guineae TaxID=432303 RepID=A0A2G1VEH3_9GAMM|nr:hypothetical protein [Marinobacter guineae]PHQ25165.1 hypothetical protein CLH62_12520 [Marinobacter guineae]
MKVAKIIFAFSVVWSGLVLAEPYAEWGTIAGGMPLAELDPDMEVPDSSKVPIPPPPSGKFISGGGDVSCAIAVRTELPVEEVCAYYKSELMPMGYLQVVDTPGLNSEGCQIYKDGDMLTDFGVMVEKNEDRMFVENGSTHVMISYLPTSRGNCE